MAYRNRREDLGRNRRSPARQKTMQWFTVGCVAIASAGLVAYDYFTEPQRVYGANELDCPPYEIEWQPDTGGLTKITGCGKSIRAKCDQTQCATPDP